MADIDISIYDEVSLTESYTGYGELPADVYDSVSVAESVSSQLITFLIHDGAEWYIPPPSLEAEFERELTMEGYVSVGYCDGEFGFEVTGYLPTITGEGEFTFAEPMTLTGLLSAPSLVGEFGLEVDSYIPQLTISAELSDLTLSLEGRLSALRGEGSFDYDGTLTAEGYFPPLLLTGEVSSDFDSTLAMEGYLPPFLFKAVADESRDLTLTGYVPTMLIELELEQLSMTMTGFVPALVGASGLGAGEDQGIAETPVLYDSTLYDSDYIIQYERFPS